MTEKIFMKITNKDIYCEIQELKRQNEDSHGSIIRRLDITNGKVKLSKWMATTAVTLTILVLGFLIQHMINKP